MSQQESRRVLYGRYVLLIAGLGGLLYGVDIGIIAAALLYLGKTISLSVQQTSVVVAAVLGGGMVSSLVAGVLADWIGRKKMMILSGLIFVSSVGIIVVSQGFVPLLLGRLLQGISGGFIAVVVPLYLAECLAPEIRGRGTAIFQFALTFGIVVAALTGFYYTARAEAAIAAAQGNAVLIRAAQDHAWRSMFLFVVYPGLMFFVGSFFLAESPRWLFRKGLREEALQALRRAQPEEKAQLQIDEMTEIAAISSGTAGRGETSSLLRRKYVVPFLLACAVLTLNQATGINSVLQYLVVILRQGGSSAQHSTQGDVVVKVLNCVVTLVGVAFVDRKGRRFLLKIGTGGIIVALIAGGLLFRHFESERVDVAPAVRAAVQGDTVRLPVNRASLAATSGAGAADADRMILTVLYNDGEGDHVAAVRSDDADPVLQLKSTSGKPLTIKQAQWGPVPTENTGWLVTASLALFISAYAFGPGVVVWLMLSELMPPRIRSVGMGIALLLNQGMGTLIAAIFLPTVGRFGYAPMFFGWAVCTAVYFAIVYLFLPETKGKTLEEIETFFDGSQRVERA